MREPTAAEIITAAIDARLAALHTCLPGKIVSYNPALQTAEIQPSVQAAVEQRDGSFKHETIPNLPNVPIVFARGGGWRLIFPLSAGDHVLLVFSEAATAQWRSTGQLSKPGDVRRHDLSYAFAIPGIGPTADPLLPPVGDELVIDGGGVVRVGGGALGTASKFVALAEKVLTELTAIKTYLDLHVHSGVTTGAGVTGAPSAPMPAPSSVAATKLKSE